MKPTPKTKECESKEEHRVGGQKITLYAGKVRVAGTIYSQWTLVWWDGELRKRKRFASEEAARAELAIVKEKVAKGYRTVLNMTAGDRDAYATAVSKLAKVGKELPSAVDEYVQALTLLPENAGLIAAVQDYTERQKRIRATVWVPEVVKDYLEAKERGYEESGKDGDRHMDDLRSRLEHFANAFRMPIMSLTEPMLTEYIGSLRRKRDGKNTTPRTKLNHLRHITSLCRWAVRKKLAHQDLLGEIAALDKPREPMAKTLVFTPQELRLILDSIRPELVPWVSIAGLAGLRTAEIMRLDWRDVHLAERYIEIHATVAKTGAARHVPICDALAEWLTPHVQAEGRVAYFSEENKLCGAVLVAVAEYQEEAIRLAQEKGEKPPRWRIFRWKKNAMRHSYVSYRLAITKDAARVSLEAGNSPQMVFKHYNKTSTEEEAQRWFNVRPTRTDGIIQLPAEGVA